MSAGKGSAPRNLGPKFRENYDTIAWTEGQRIAAENRAECNKLTDKERKSLLKAAKDMFIPAKLWKRVEP